MGKYIGEMKALIDAAFQAVECRCLYHDRDGKRCKERAIQSHSLQKRGPLASIVEDGHVTKIGPTLRARKTEVRQLFERHGHNRASVFPGFCNQHDAGVFSEIEGAKINLNERIALVFAIRSCTMEHYRKQVMVALQKRIIRFLETAGRQDGIQENRWILRGASRAVEHGESRVRELFSYFHKGLPRNFLYLACRFSEESPFACTGAFEPDRDMDARILFLCNPLKTKWNFVSIFAGNVSGNFYLFISGVQKYRNHRIDRFLRSIRPNENDFISKSFTTCALHSENVYARSSWIDSLELAEIRKINEIMASGVLEGLRRPEPYAQRVDLPVNQLEQLSSRTQA